MSRSVSATLARLALGATTVFLAACGSPTIPEFEIEFRTDRSSYVLGDTASLTVTNRGLERIGPAGLPCLLQLERKVGPVWDFVSSPETGSSTACTGRSWLEPSQQEHQRVPITASDFRGGAEYRFKTSFWDASREFTTEVVSNSFTIDG